MKGTLELSCGPSGVGKSSNFDRKKKVFTYTTRPKVAVEEIVQFIEDFKEVAINQLEEAIALYQIFQDQLPQYKILGVNQTVMLMSKAGTYSKIASILSMLNGKNEKTDDILIPARKAYDLYVNIFDNNIFLDNQQVSDNIFYQAIMINNYFPELTDRGLKCAYIVRDMIGSQPFVDGLVDNLEKILGKKE